jgi:hypothetical protein
MDWKKIIILELVVAAVAILLILLAKVGVEHLVPSLYISVISWIILTIAIPFAVKYKLI